MGNETVVARVSAMLSRHNSPRDVEHDRLWADACARIRAVVDDPQYQPILLDGEGLDPEGGGMYQAAEAKPVVGPGRQTVTREVRNDGTAAITVDADLTGLDTGDGVVFDLADLPVLRSGDTLTLNYQAAVQADDQRPGQQ